MKCPLEIGGHSNMSDDGQKLRVRHVGRDGRRRYEPGSKARQLKSLAEN